jgi:repressor LexA
MPVLKGGHVMPIKGDLNEKQEKVYEFMKNSINEKGFPPTVREICKATGIKSTSSVHAILSKLEELKYIQKDPTHPRAIKILGNEDEVFKTRNILKLSNSKAVEVPLIGQVAAGSPLLAVENIQEYFPVPESFAKDKDVFLLKIKGDSMLNAGILNNDLVLVEKKNIAHNREIVVALIDDEATVKTYYKEKDHIRLQPENDFYEPIICNDKISILGKVIGVFRKL